VLSHISAIHKAVLMTVRAEPTVGSVFGNLQRKLAGSRCRHEWRLIPIGLRGKVLRVLVVYLNRRTLA
jgi:hypothetical protein